MRVRDAKPGEDAILYELFFNTVHRINTRHYTPSQVRAWAPREMDISVWAGKMRAIRPFVAEMQGRIVGYSDLQPGGLIDHLYVHCDWQGRGVGRVLMQEIERRASVNGIGVLETHASITARPFFQAFGFAVVSEQEVKLENERLKNYVMRRGGGDDT